MSGLYEKNLNTNEGTSYYFAGSQRVAMRETTSSSDTVYYFVADHLGSTSITLDASGNKISEQKYYPFGETRSGSSPTDRQFTGQRAENGLGSLYDYNARMYSPSLNVTFVQYSSDTTSGEFRVDNRIIGTIPDLVIRPLMALLFGKH